MKASSWLMLALLTAAAAVPRAWPVAERALWLDEASTVHSARHGPLAMLRWNHHFEHPPLSYALVSLSMKGFSSDEEWVVRMPSLVAGIACVPLVFALGHSLAGASLGAAAAALVAVDPNMVDQSQQARMYTLFVLVLILTTLHLHRTLEQANASGWRWLVLGALLAGALFTSLLGVLVWAAFLVAIAALAWVGPRTGPRGWLLSGAALAMTFAVAAGQVGLAKLAQLATKGGPLPDVPTTVARVGEAALALEPLLGAAPLSAVGLVAATAGLLLLYRRAPGTALFLLALLALNLAALVPLRADHHMLSVRYASALQLPLWIGIACWVQLPAGRALRAVAWTGVAVLVCTSGWYSLHHFVLESPGKYAPGELARRVGTRVEAGDPVVLVPPWLWKLGAYYIPAGSPRTEPGADDPRVNCTTATTWILLAHLRSRPSIEEAFETVRGMVGECPAPLEDEPLAALLASHGAVALRLSPSGSTVIVEPPAPPSLAEH